MGMEGKVEKDRRSLENWWASRTVYLQFALYSTVHGKVFVKIKHASYSQRSKKK
jgi:hypothetical protein